MEVAHMEEPGGQVVWEVEVKMMGREATVGFPEQVGQEVIVVWEIYRVIRGVMVG